MLELVRVQNTVTVKVTIFTRKWIATKSRTSYLRVQKTCFLLQPGSLWLTFTKNCVCFILLQLRVNISNIFAPCYFSEINIYLCIIITSSNKINFCNAEAFWMQNSLSEFFIYKTPRFKYVKHMRINLGTSPERRTQKMFLNEVLRKILRPKGRETHPDDRRRFCGWSLWLISIRSDHVLHDEFELFQVSKHEHLL